MKDKRQDHFAVQYNPLKSDRLGTHEVVPIYERIEFIGISVFNSCVKFEILLKLTH